MKSIKKVIALSAAVAVAATSLIVFKTSAADTGKVSITGGSAKVGETITLTVTMDENPGIIGWRTLLAYDSDAFEITDFTPGVFSGTAGGDISKQPNPFRFSWGDSIHGDYTTTGKMAEITFKVKDGTDPGKYTFTLSGDADDFFNSDYDNVPFTFGSANVTVVAPVTGVSVNPTSHDFSKAGETFDLAAIITPANATNKKVSYTSSDTSVATVDANGKVTAVNEGAADITVKTEDGGFTAVCSVTVAHEHKMQKIDAKESTCIEQGNNEYYYCTSCKKYFKDEEGKTATTVEAEKLALAAHKFTKQDTAAKYLKSAATCVDKAVYYYSCEVCGEKGTEAFEYGEVDKTNHVGETELRDKKDATCTKKGYTGDTYCKSCGDIIEKGKEIDALGHSPAETWSFDAESHWKVCTVCDVILDKAAHNGGEATCISKAVCKDCGEEYGEVDPDNHKGQTEIRGYVAPTVESAGYSGDKYCLDCNKMIEEGKELPPHVHQLKKIDAKEATHFAAGNIEYYECEEDGMLFKDAEAKEPITIEATVIPQIPHTFGEEWKSDSENHWHECECGEKADTAAHTFGDWKVVKEATVEAEGSEERACTVCGAVETRATDKLQPETPPEDDNKGNAPEDNTGGNPGTGAASAFALVSAIALCGVVISKKRR